jgi:hypothetical protein
MSPAGESDLLPPPPGSPTTGLTAIQRKKKPKRRSTGVLSAELDHRSDESADEVSLAQRLRVSPRVSAEVGPCLPAGGLRQESQWAAQDPAREGTVPSVCD